MYINYVPDGLADTMDVSVIVLTNVTELVINAQLNDSGWFVCSYIPVCEGFGNIIDGVLFSSVNDFKLNRVLA